MSDIAKKGIAIVVSALIVGVAYYGSYLPFRKSMRFIHAINTLEQARSLEEFETILSQALDYPSPIGQEEVVRNTGNIVMNTIQGGAPSAETLRELVDFIERYYRPIIDRGRGMSFGQNVYLLGLINQIAYIQTQQVPYLQAAKEYYEMGYELGPKRPEILYGLFDVYRIIGDREKVSAITEQILKQWPNDERIKAFYRDFVNETGN